MVELECLPFGVGHGDEGICLLIQMGPHRVLLDCGLRDISGLQNSRMLTQKLGRTPQPSLPADLALCTHAHPDHAQGLLALHHAFPALPIYASEVTTYLLPLNWPKLGSDKSLVSQTLPWRSPIQLKDSLSVELLPAGHLPGAAAFLLTYTPPHRKDEPATRSYTVLYTGDFFLSNSRLVEGLPLEDYRGLTPDVLIVEGTFGTARHPHRRQQENQLAERISQALAQGFSLILPVPILGLGQELLMLLRSHHYFTGRDIDIWVDGPIADGCDAYLDILPHLPSTVQNFAQHQPLFWDERIRPRVRRLKPEQRSSISQSPCVVLVDQTADLREYCSARGRPWLLLLPQHLGGSFDPVTPVIQKLQTEMQAGRLVLETYLLAQHCDAPGTTQLIHNLRPQHVIFVHGSPLYLTDLASLDELSNRYHLHCPSAGTRVELPIGETFLQPTPPETETIYEGELTSLGTGVTITMPEEIITNPRWQNFADTGLVEARWQGEELVLRGIPQRELLQEQVNSPATAFNLDCCATCQHFRGQRCRNPASSLFGFKVTPEGYCPAFESANENSTDDYSAVE